MSERTSRVLVTGGAGFIGSHIVASLVDGRDGLIADEIVVLDDMSRGTRRNLAPIEGRGNVRLVEGDVRDRALVAEVMKGVDLLFHQAAIRITRCASEPRLCLEVLVDGAYNVFEAAQQAGVRKVLAASTASVYGLADTFPTGEDHHPYNNRTIYGAAKAFNEGLLRSFNEMYGLSYVAIRPFNVYGPHMDTHGAYTEVFIRWMDRISAGEPPLIFGDGTQTMDFVYVEDVARAYVLAALSPASDVVLNCGSGVETSLKDLATTLCKVMGADLAPAFGPERKVNPVRRRLADVSAAKRLIGWEPRVPLEEGLRRLYAWWRAEKAAAPAPESEAARVR